LLISKDISAGRNSTNFASLGLRIFKERAGRWRGVRS
jgi:hypothetical protein